jgi:glycosyltransferase involved in cell wall biosynthesis
MKIVLVSFTPIEDPGGVPRWCRDFRDGFPKGSVVHYSWSDVVHDVGRDYDLPEWEKARCLSNWLKFKRKVERDDIIVGDGFWADGFNADRTVSVCHGNWSHTTAADVAKGIPPEFPRHHEAQLEFRLRFSGLGGRLVSVSDFIASQCYIQWGLRMPVINNGIDLEKFVPSSIRVHRERPLIIHGVTNSNKGFDHIDALKFEASNPCREWDVMLLDDVARYLKIPKYDALAQADLVVIPSAHEGNSYFLLETLASNIPIVAYDVGLLYRAFRESPQPSLGRIIAREERDARNFASKASHLMTSTTNWRPFIQSREWVSQFSVQEFQRNWREYLEKEFGYVDHL